MKKTLIILILNLSLFSKVLNSQTSGVDSLKLILDSLYNSFVIYPGGIVSNDYRLDSMDFVRLNLGREIVKHRMKSCDTTLLHLLENYIHFRDDVLDLDYISTLPLRIGEDSFYMFSKDFISMNIFCPIDSNHIIDSILDYDEVQLLKYFEISRDTNFLGKLFRENASDRKYNYAIDRLYELFDSTVLLDFYYNNKRYFMKDANLFLQRIIRSKKENKPFSILPLDEQDYLQVEDTIGYWQKGYYHYIFKGGKDPEEIRSDSIYWAEKPEEDRKLEEWRKQKETEQEEYYRINDSISLATIYDRIGLYWKYAYSDTTLWEANGSVPVLEVDDGMRFDTFPSGYLLSIIDTLSFHNVYDTMQDGLDLNQSVTVIHLRKIFQILGDRCAYGLFVPDSSQRIILDQWIDDYYTMACNDTIYYKRYEACHQMLRMWRLLFPKLKNWIGIESKCANGMICVLQQLSNMVTESMVLDIIADGDVALAYGDTARVETLGYFLARVWRDLEIPENQRIQRRPVRTAIETQQWVDAYIYPALVRWNHPTSWK
ncbi:MAG: hypothetical protein ABI851_16150 [Saprospiraceae bacterium]